jgi:5-methylcytosine-specific restriction endonuclease McrA
MWRPATVVDHITPIRGASDPNFYRESNHQALCSSCHDAKRGREAHATPSVEQNLRRKSAEMEHKRERGARTREFR